MHASDQVKLATTSASMEILMNSRITLKGIFSAAIVFVPLLFTSLAHAQGGQEITVRIPFEFSVNRLHCEAGSYKFNLELDKFEMSIINLGTGKKQYIPVRPQSNLLSAASGFLVFRQIGEAQYLSEVHFSGASDYSGLTIQQKFNIGDRGTILRGAFTQVK
jgi:hypothetical protein